MHIKLPKGAKFLELESPEKIKKIWEEFNNINGLFDDFSKNNFNLFYYTRLMAKDAVWLEREDGNGLLYATKIVPNLHANVHFVYWDRRLKGRELFSLDCLQWLMASANLKKVNAWIPDFCKAARHFANRLGFKEEGIIRRWSYSNGKLYDIVVYGLLREEIEDGQRRFLSTEQGEDKSERIRPTEHGNGKQPIPAVHESASA